MSDMETTDRTAPEATPADGKARWTRLAVVGFIMIALGPLLMIGGGLAWGMELGEELAFFGAVIVVPLVAAFLVWRFGRWAKIVGAILAFLAAGSMFWTAFGLGTPQSFFDFVPGLLVLPGGIIAIASCIGAVVADRRGHVTAAPVGGERRALRIVPGAVILLAILSAGLTFAGSSSVDASQADTEVTLSDFDFDQDHYEFTAGTTILVRNDDAFLHTFTVEDWDVDEALGPGSEVLVEVPATTGEFVVFCRPHTGDPESPGEDDMAARATVQ